MTTGVELAAGDVTGIFNHSLPEDKMNSIQIDQAVEINRRMSTLDQREKDELVFRYLADQINESKLVVDTSIEIPAQANTEGYITRTANERDILSYATESLKQFQLRAVHLINKMPEELGLYHLQFVCITDHIKTVNENQNLKVKIASIKFWFVPAGN